MKSSTIAVVGASNDRRKFGNKCVRAYLQAGWRVFPVNLHATEIEGQKVCASLAAVPVELDRVSIYLPPPVTRRLLPELENLTGAQIWFNPGAADGRLLEAARQAGLDVHDGCSILDIGLAPGQFP